MITMFEEVITERAQKTFKSILEIWSEEMYLPGDLSYGDVIDLCKLLRVEVPNELRRFLNDHA